MVEKYLRNSGFRNENMPSYYEDSKQKVDKDNKDKEKDNKESKVKKKQNDVN